MRVLLALLLSAGPALAEPAIPRFVEEPGPDSTYAGGWEYMVGGGAASCDCDADGLSDLLLAGGEAPARFLRNRSTQGGPLDFAAEPSGLELTAVTGAYPLDADSDGVMDLALLRVGETVLMRGLGDCRFARANEDWGFDGGDAWTTAFAATWEAGADWPTLALGTYIDRTQEDFPWGSCTENRLYRPAGRGFAAPLPLTPSYCALSMLFTDWNRSGQPALRVSNDREYYKGGQEQLWHIAPGEAPRLYTEAEGWARLRIWGMGIASQDLTGDGYPEYFLTSMADNKLQSLAATDAPLLPRYDDIAFARGATAHRPPEGGDLRPSTAWHPEFADVNNDGLSDLFIAKGNVSEMPDFAVEDPNNLLLQRPDGSFREAAAEAGVASVVTARGAALADFNMDGLLDLVVVNRNAPAQLWRNAGGATGHWIGVRPRQPGPNPDAVGGWLELRQGERIARREITVGGGHAGGQTGWLHLGLGAGTEAELRMIWPDGEAGDWQSLPADGFWTLTRGAPPQQWQGR